MACSQRSTVDLEIDALFVIEMKEIKQMAEGRVTNTQVRMSTGEPAQSAVERITEKSEGSRNLGLSSSIPYGIKPLQPRIPTVKC